MYISVIWEEGAVPELGGPGGAVEGGDGYCLPLPCRVTSRRTGDPGPVRAWSPVAVLDPWLEAGLGGACGRLSRRDPGLVPEPLCRLLRGLLCFLSREVLLESLPTGLAGALETS